MLAKGFGMDGSQEATIANAVVQVAHKAGDQGGDDDSALPTTPRISLEDVDDPYPDPINPSTDPLALLTPSEAKTKRKNKRSAANRGGEK